MAMVWLAIGFVFIVCNEFGGYCLLNPKWALRNWKNAVVYMVPILLFFSSNEGTVNFWTGMPKCWRFAYRRCNMVQGTMLKVLFLGGNRTKLSFFNFLLNQVFQIGKGVYQILSISGHGAHGHCPHDHGKQLFGELEGGYR